MRPIGTEVNVTNEHDSKSENINAELLALGEEPLSEEELALLGAGDLEQPDAFAALLSTTSGGDFDDARSTTLLGQMLSQVERADNIGDQLVALGEDDVAAFVWEDQQARGRHIGSVVDALHGDAEDVDELALPESILPKIQDELETLSLIRGATDDADLTLNQSQQLLATTEEHARENPPEHVLVRLKRFRRVKTFKTYFAAAAAVLICVGLAWIVLPSQSAMEPQMAEAPAMEEKAVAAADMAPEPETPSAAPAAVPQVELESAEKALAKAESGALAQMLSAEGRQGDALASLRSARHDATRARAQAKARRL